MSGTGDVGSFLPSEPFAVVASGVTDSREHFTEAHTLSAEMQALPNTENADIVLARSTSPLPQMQSSVPSFSDASLVLCSTRQNARAVTCRLCAVIIFSFP